jgi:hypothetical protein
MIYSIASGIGKARLTAQATLRGRYVWQTFVLFSSECGLEAKIRGDGPKRAGVTLSTTT